MQEWIWLNGRVTALRDARIGVEDRGFQFGDGVYDVARLYRGRPYRFIEHLERLAASAAGIEMELPLSVPELADEIRRRLAGDDSDGIVYMQLTRGNAQRNHLYPAPELVPPTLLFFRREMPAPLTPVQQTPGLRLHATDDFRWKRCWIKSVSLLANVLAKNAAVRDGADEAVFIDNGVVTECSVSNFAIVTDGGVVTHPAGNKVLGGITIQAVRDVAAELGIAWEERPIQLADALAAQEMFVTSTTREIGWVSHWDQRPIGSAKCGPVTQALHEAFVQSVRRETAADAVLTS